MSCGCLKTSRQSHFPLTNSSGCDGILRPPSVMRLCKAGASSEVLVLYYGSKFSANAFESALRRLAHRKFDIAGSPRASHRSQGLSCVTEE